MHFGRRAWWRQFLVGDVDLALGIVKGLNHLSDRLLPEKLGASER